MVVEVTKIDTIEGKQLPFEDFTAELFKKLNEISSNRLENIGAMHITISDAGTNRTYQRLVYKSYETKIYLPPSSVDNATS